MRFIHITYFTSSRLAQILLSTEKFCYSIVMGPPIVVTVLMGWISICYIVGLTAPWAYLSYKVSGSKFVCC